MKKSSSIFYVLLTLYVHTSSYKSCKKCTGKGIARPTTEETREVMIAELDITVKAKSNPKENAKL
jgi:hypothetical protein